MLGVALSTSMCKPAVLTLVNLLEGGTGEHITAFLRVLLKREPAQECPLIDQWGGGYFWMPLKATWTTPICHLSHRSAELHWNLILS